jgi:hypothetical protein
VLIRSIAIASALALTLGLAATSNAAEKPQTGTSGAKTKTTPKQVLGAPKRPPRTGVGGIGGGSTRLNGTHLTGIALIEAGGLGSGAIEGVVLPDGGVAGR